MKTIISILSKTIVRSFYKEYALLFLIGLIVCFGFLKTDDHIFLAKYIVSSNFLIGIYFVIWTVYNLFIIAFFINFFKDKRNFFLFDLVIVKKIPLFISLMVLHFNLLAPVLIYAVFVAGIAASQSFLNQIIYIVVFLIFTSIYPILIYLKTISNPDVSLSEISFFRISLKFKKKPFSFFIFHLLESEWLKLLITKGISVFLLLALSQILQTDNDDIRPLLVVVLLGFLPNFSIIGIYHDFENQIMMYFKNLPIKLPIKWLTAVTIFAIILIPELFLLYRYAWAELPWYAPILGYLLGLALSSLYYSSLYLKIAVEERFSNLLFFAAVICFLAILFKINVLIIVAAVFAISYLVFTKLYYQYEFVAKSSS